jgi:cell division protein FtsI/penicillin-binding protein 2
VLFRDPPPGGEQAPAAPPVTHLAAGASDTLLGLMRRVVAEGSGTAAAVPGADIAGKTGTAEYDQGDPPPTHAWFIGIRGDLSVSVLVEGGGVGGQVAAPLAGQVLAGLPG